MPHGQSSKPGCTCRARSCSGPTWLCSEDARRSRSPQWGVRGRDRALRAWGSPSLLWKEAQGSAVGGELASRRHQGALTGMPLVHRRCTLASQQGRVRSAGPAHRPSPQHGKAAGITLAPEALSPLEAGRCGQIPPGPNSTFTAMLSPQKHRERGGPGEEPTGGRTAALAATSDEESPREVVGGLLPNYFMAMSWLHLGPRPGNQGRAQTNRTAPGHTWPHLATPQDGIKTCPQGSRQTGDQNRGGGEGEHHTQSHCAPRGCGYECWCVCVTEVCARVSVHTLTNNPGRALQLHVPQGTGVLRPTARG